MYELNALLAQKTPLWVQSSIWSKCEWRRLKQKLGMKDQNANYKLFRRVPERRGSTRSGWSRWKVKRLSVCMHTHTHTQPMHECKFNSIAVRLCLDFTKQWSSKVQMTSKANWLSTFVFLMQDRKTWIEAMKGRSLAAFAGPAALIQENLRQNNEFVCKSRKKDENQKRSDIVCSSKVSKPMSIDWC